MDVYLTLAGAASARLTRERSRFLAFVEPVAAANVAERLGAYRRKHRDASHVCSAFRCRQGNEVIAAADDAGEPRGSAGLPILQELEGAGLLDVLAVVVRHFGGVKLGMGGLVRAYGDATAEALAAATAVERRIEATLHLAFPHEAHAAVLRTLHRQGARVLDIRYDTQGEAVVAISPSHVTALAEALREETGARACVTRVT